MTLWSVRTGCFLTSKNLGFPKSVDTNQKSILDCVDLFIVPHK